MPRRVISGGWRRFAPVALLVAVAAGVGLWRGAAPRPLPPDEVAALYARPLPPPEGALAVYHLGHSLVNRTMPAMLAQLAPDGHDFASQLGWGASLADHWRGPEAVAGFAEENDHDRFRPAGEALDSGAYDAVVLTEMVEIRDAIRHHGSWKALRDWAARARAARPAARIYLYETWHRTDDPEGWLDRIDADLSRYWERGILDRALAAGVPGGPIHLIPAGQVLAAFVRRAEAEPGGIGGIDGRAALFAETPEGDRDTIHLNDLGNYLVALTHYAVLYHRDPVGVPHRLRRPDGSPAYAPSAEAARAMQVTVAQVVAGLARTGVGGLRP